MGNDDFGESSCKRPGNDDKMSDADRPLKKAKFPWQVKGRYHLRDRESNIDDNAQEEIQKSSPSSEEESDSSDMDQEEMKSKAEENLEILGDYLLKQDFSTLKPLMDTPADKSDSSRTTSPSVEETTSSGKTNEPNHYPIYTTSVEHLSRTKAPVGDSQQTVFTMSTTKVRFPWTSPVVKREKTHDQQLARWQARQLAKGFVDNTINRVLDSWLVAPLPQSLEYQNNLALDVADFFDNLPTSDTSVENEGILMAISAHGLQSSSNPNISNNFRKSNSDLPSSSFSTTRNRTMSDTALLDDKATKSKRSKPSNTEETTSGSCSWMRQPCNCPLVHSRRTISFEILPGGDVPFHRRDSPHVQATNPPTRPNEMVSTPIVKENPTPAKETEKEMDQSMAEKSSESSDEDYQADMEQLPSAVSENNEPDKQFGEHFDFMDAAVSYAIQNKGLTSFGNVDYG